MASPFHTLRFCVLAAAALAAGCSRSPQDGGKTLRVADQLNAVQAVLTAAHENQPKDYRLDWSNFVGGPPIIAAETGGSVDLGWMAETPLIFAQAAGSPVKVVAVSRGTLPGSSNIALVVPAGSPIRTVADLRGKKVGYMPGTIAQYLIVRLLDKAGLSPADITTVRITSFNQSILEHGIVDAMTGVEPQLSESLAEGKIRVLAYGGEPITPSFGYLVASDAALADPKRAALIGEFVQRLARATLWTHANIDKAAPFIARSYKTTPQIAALILRRTPAHYASIDASVLAAHQQEADLFFKLGLIQHRLDAVALFDHRYDKFFTRSEHAPTETAQ